MSLPILLLSIAAVSVILNLVSKEESAYVFFTYLIVSELFILVNKAESVQICFAYLLVSSAFNFKSNAVCVLALIGFSVSAVLFILSKANVDFKEAKLATPVPPFATGTMPAILSASTLFANCA